jgi:hypothetical protein
LYDGELYNESRSKWEGVGAADAAEVSPRVNLHRVAECTKVKLDNEILQDCSVPSLGETGGNPTPSRLAAAASVAVLRGS